MSKLFGYCTACETYCYRLIGFKHGDGQQDSESNQIWLSTDISDMTNEEIELADNNKINCGCTGGESSLMDSYKAWRKVSEEMLEDGMNGSVDCGEQAVREDFSNYANLEEEINFEEMLKLEEAYNG